MAKLETIGRAGALAALALGAGSAAWAQSHARRAPAAGRPAGQAVPAAAKPRAAPPAKRASPNAAADEAADTAEASEVVMPPERPPNQQYGAVVGDIAPELQMTPSEIQSYGVSTVTDLLNEIAPQTRSDRGRGATAAGGAAERAAHLQPQRGRQHPHRGDPAGRHPARGGGAEVRLHGRPAGGEHRAEAPLPRDDRRGGRAARPPRAAIATGQAEVDQFQVRRDVRTNLDMKYQVSRRPDRRAARPGRAAGRRAVRPRRQRGLADAGGEIDPALSALVGEPVTIAGVPAGVAADQRLTLADFVPTAGVANVTDTAGRPQPGAGDPDADRQRGVRAADVPGHQRHAQRHTGRDQQRRAAGPAGRQPAGAGRRSVLAVRRAGERSTATSPARARCSRASTAGPAASGSPSTATSATGGCR